MQNGKLFWYSNRASYEKAINIISHSICEIHFNNRFHNVSVYSDCLTLIYDPFAYPWHPYQNNTLLLKRFYSPNALRVSAMGESEADLRREVRRLRTLLEAREPLIARGAHVDKLESTLRDKEASLAFCQSERELLCKLLFSERELHTCTQSTVDELRLRLRTIRAEYSLFSANAKLVQLDLESASTHLKENVDKLKCERELFAKKSEYDQGRVKETEKRIDELQSKLEKAASERDDALAELKQYKQRLQSTEKACRQLEDKLTSTEEALPPNSKCADEGNHADDVQPLVPNLNALISPAPLQKRRSVHSHASDVVSESRSRFTNTLPFTASENVQRIQRSDDGVVKNISKIRDAPSENGIGTEGIQLERMQPAAHNKRRRTTPLAHPVHERVMYKSVRKTASQKPPPANGGVEERREQTGRQPPDSEPEERKVGGRELRARRRVSYNYDEQGRDVEISNPALEIDFRALRKMPVASTRRRSIAVGDGADSQAPREPLNPSTSPRRGRRRSKESSRPPRQPV